MAPGSPLPPNPSAGVSTAMGLSASPALSIYEYKHASPLGMSTRTCTHMHTLGMWQTGPSPQASPLLLSPVTGHPVLRLIVLTARIEAGSGRV